MLDDVGGSLRQAGSVCADAMDALQQTAESLTQRNITQLSSCTNSFTEQCSDEKGTASHAPPADIL